MFSWRNKKNNLFDASLIWRYESTMDLFGCLDISCVCVSTTGWKEVIAVFVFFFSTPLLLYNIEYYQELRSQRSHLQH